MRHILLALLVLICLLSSAAGRRRKEVIQEETSAPDERVEVAEANHFSSETQRSTSITASDLVQDKPLMFLLEPNQMHEETNVTFQISSNPVTVTIEAGNEKETCQISNYYGLCSLAKITTEQATIKVECKSTPCQMRWRVEQPQTVEIDGQHKLNHLVSVNQDKNHAILKVYCSNPELKSQLPTNLELYTNSAFEEITTGEEEIIYLFNNEQKGSYFLSTKNTAIEGCAQVTLQHAIEEIELKSEGVLFHDFFSNRETNTYELTSKPTTDLMLEMSAHDAGMSVFQNETGIEVKLVGISNKKETVLQELQLFVDNQKQFIDFSTIFKSPSSQFDKYELHLKGLSQDFLIGTLNFKATNKPEVQFQEQSWFDLKKGQKVQYKLVAIEKEVDNIDKQNIFVSDANKFKLSTDSCGKDGCEFTVQATEDGKGYVYIGQDVKNKKQKEIVMEQFNKTVRSKLREGEERFYEYKIGANQAVQMLVNSPSVVVYAADKKKCAAQNLSKCYQKQFNFHNPSFYESKEAVEVGLKVVGLDNCEFTITMLQANQPYIELKDTEPFVYLMDDNENELIFAIKLDKKEDVSFNLIAPLNQLTLEVFNKQNLGKEDSTEEAKEAEISMDGYVFIEKADLKTVYLVAKVVKREEYRKKYVHFTLIVSTKESNLRLEAGNAHYQTLKPSTTRDYVFELNTDKKMFLNFYTHNLQDNINLVATISPTDQYKDKESTVTFKIDRQTDVIEIGSVSEKLCSAESEEQCELFVRVRNDMSVEVDVTITLLVTDSVIELKDGIWQTYDINEAAATAHFYFLPKHEKHSITIFYHSYNVDLKLAYNLWQTDDTSIVPSEWPFPYKFNETAMKSPSPLSFKPTRFIHIQRSQLQACWPNCVVLLSILPSQKELQKFQKSPVPFFNVNHDFKIMASNNYIQIPQKIKIDIVLNRAEEKYLLVDLKYHMQKESLVFFNYLTTGSIIFKGNVYSEKNPRCPTIEEGESDFQFVGIESQFEIETIKKKLEQNNMENDKNQYICILAYSFVESKASIEFVSEMSDIKSIPIDTTTAVTLRSGQTRIFQLYAHFEFYLKISRTVGFPYVSRKLCDPKNIDMEKCLQDFKNSEEKGEQLVNKIMAITETSCPSCMLFVKVQAKEEANLTLHSQSRYAEIQIKENNPLTDVLAPNQVNRYLITTHRQKEVILNIQILSGNIKIELHDFDKVHISKQNAKGSTAIHLVVPSKDQVGEKKDMGTNMVQAFGLSNFNQLHLSVQAQNPKEPANYIITYSNGEQITFLEDGLISQHTLRANQPTKFLYNSPNTERLYLYLSAPDAQILNNLTPTVFGLNNPEDEDDRVQLPVEKPTFMKKTLNPTMLVLLPGKSHYQILIQNKNSKDISLSIGINNREIIYLPYDREFPFKLEPKQYLYFSLPVSAAGYVKFTMNKCSSCEPFVAFTEDYNDFVSESFETEEQISDSLTYENVIHVKKAGGIYFKIRSKDDEESILTVKASFSPTKIVQSKAKAGNKGNIEYQLLDSTKAEITYSGVVCEKSCQGQFSYSAITSPVMNRIISQLVCTSVSFDLLGFTQKDAPEVENISSKSDAKIIFNHTLKEHTEYLGIKAFNSKTGDLVYYPPVEIITFQGRIDKAVVIVSQQHNLSWIVVTVVLIALCWVLIAYRRYSKKRESYLPLNPDIHDTIDD